MPEIDGGYDDGYERVASLWGAEPGSLVRSYIDTTHVQGAIVLDIGAGEGKNSAPFAARGAQVDAVECSPFAIRNGRAMFAALPINWVQADVRKWQFPLNHYDVVVSYGLTHCMESQEEAEALLDRSKGALKRGGSYILVAFNAGPHDLSAHPGFTPLLLEHQWYLDRFLGWDVITETNSLLYETHPHNNIPHYHSMTRLRAQKL